MRRQNEVIRVIKDFVGILPFIAAYKPPADDKAISIGLAFQQTAARHAHRPAIIFEGRELSWLQINELANQFAHLLKQQGLKRGDVVSLLMDNRIEMLAAMIGASKIGATVALINTNLRGKPLTHCIGITESTKCLLGEELQDAIAEVRSELPLADGDYLWIRDKGVRDKGGSTDDKKTPAWAVDVMANLHAMPVVNLEETADICAGSKALYIFTSGTTGLPKAAIIYHRRFMGSASVGWKVGLRAKAKDRIYLCLPLYHFTGLSLGFGSSMLSGATLILKRKFSAREFWPEVKKHRANKFVYVGELCRYLSMQAEHPDEIDNPIQTMMGIGLRPDVWDLFRSRFKVQRISEVYGSSEGNASFYNLLNKDRTIGTTTASIMLVEYNVDEDEIVRHSSGQLVESKQGEPGLLIAKIEGRYAYDGYQDKEATNSKILADVKKPGDRWFNTGDLVKRIDVGFALGLPHYQFVDRVGDTFRWRAENVSTNEVSEILTAFEQIDIANVYGVEIPSAEGKAGMAAITLHQDSSFDAAAFSEFVNEQLHAHARPVFIRLQPIVETTGTFKLVKVQLKKEAYHLDKVNNEPVYVMKPRQAEYELLDDAFYQLLKNGEVGY